MKNQMQIILKRTANSAKTFVRTMSRMITSAPRTMPTNCVNINALLLHLCDFDPITYSYALKWLAYPIQNPGAKMQRALMINGPQGTGTSLFFDRVVAALYGDQGRHINGHQLANRTFNDWASEARMVVVEGDYSKRLKAELKALVSSELIYINQKGLGQRIELNHMNFVFVSGQEDFLPLSACDRRFFVIEAPPARERLFYIAVAEEIENGGVDAFRDYLMSAVDLVGFNEFSAPPMAVETSQLEVA